MPPDVVKIIDSIQDGKRSAWIAEAIREKASIKEAPAQTNFDQVLKAAPPLESRPEKIAEIRRMWSAGEHNCSEIARRIGVHSTTVQRWVKKHLAEV